MKFSKILSSIAIGTFMMINQVSFAQFEGEVNMNIYHYKDGIKNSGHTLHAFFKNDRILVTSSKNIVILKNVLITNKLLIRSDFEDFIFMTGASQALKATKKEIEGAFTIIDMLIGSNVSEDILELNYTYTNRVKKIAGLNSTELRVNDIDDKGSYLSIWLTNDLGVDWGLLSKPWQNVPAKFSFSINKITQEFKSRNFPVLIEVVSNNSSKKLFEVSRVLVKKIDLEKVNISDSLELIGLQQLIMKAMMSN